MKNNKKRFLAETVPGKIARFGRNDGGNFGRNDKKISRFARNDRQGCGITSGVTLIEMMVTVTVILLALVPLLRLFINANKGNQHLAQVTVAENLIQQTFDEIGRKKWDENCPSPGEYIPTASASAPPAGEHDPWTVDTVGGVEISGDKTTFDDMDDYSTIVNDTPRDLSGKIIPGYEAFRITVEACYVSNPKDGLPAYSATKQDFKKITVSVTWKGGGTVGGGTVKTKTRIFYNGVDYRM